MGVDPLISTGWIMVTGQKAVGAHTISGMRLLAAQHRCGFVIFYLFIFYLEPCYLLFIGRTESWS